MGGLLDVKFWHDRPGTAVRYLARSTYRTPFSRRIPTLVSWLDTQGQSERVVAAAVPPLSGPVLRLVRPEDDLAGKLRK